MTKRLVLDLAEMLKKRAGKVPTEVPTPEVEPGCVAFVLNPEPDDRDLAEMQWLAYQRQAGKTGNVGFRKFMVTFCLCDEKNKRLVDSGTNEDAVSPEFVDAMKGLAKSIPMPAYIRLFNVASQNMGLNTEDIEELVKNSTTTRRAAGSGSKHKQRGKRENNGSLTSKT